MQTHLKIVFIFALFLAAVIIPGCKKIGVENVVELSANPEKVKSGSQVILTLRIYEDKQEQDGYNCFFTANSGSIVGGNGHSIFGTTLEVIYEPEIYAGDEYRLDKVSVKVTGSDDARIGEDSVTIKVIPK